MQRDRLRWSVILVGCSILGALNACVKMDAEPPESPPAPSPPPKPQFDAQVVTVDGEQFWEHRYLDRRIRVPLSDGRVSTSELSPSWYIPLPPGLPSQPPENGYRIKSGMGIRLRDAQLAEPQNASWLSLQTADPLTLTPDEVYPDWNLIFFRSPVAVAGVRTGKGNWVPADLAFRTQDGRRLVIYCTPNYTDGPQIIPHRLACSFYVKISERVLMDVNFRGTFLPDWKRVYEAAMSTIEQRVSPLDGKPAPNP